MKTQIAMRSEQAMSSGLITSAGNRNFLPGFLYFQVAFDAIQVACSNSLKQDT